MNRLSAETYQQLMQCPLDEVMRLNRHKLLRKTKKQAFFACPWHNDTDPSLKVDLECTLPVSDGNFKAAGYYCYGCGEKGVGAIALQARLMGVDVTSRDGFERACIRLAKLFGITINGTDYNSFYHRCKQVSPSKEIVFEFKDGFTVDELQSLGCKCAPVFRATKKGESEPVLDENGEQLYNYSWKGYNPEDFSMLFSIYAVDRYTTEQRESKKDGTLVSYEVMSTDTYPVFAFMFRDEKGWWAKKYEPRFQAGVDENGNRQPSYKFTWWYEGGVARDGELKNKLYGDADVMRALQGDGVRSTDPEGHPTCNVLVRKGNDEKVSVTKFRRLIICSGPRDAINVYYHSNAHVVYSHSEMTDIAPSTMRSLFDIAAEVYVLFDADETGRTMANRLAMRYINLRLIKLPADLCRIKSARTGKPCKDAEEYFTYYESRLKLIEDFRGRDINFHFSTLMANAKTMKFWSEKYTSTKDEFGDKVVFVKYTINIDNMAQFLGARGLRRYRPSKGAVRFVLMQNNVVRFIPDEEVQTIAKQLMKEFLANHPEYSNADLSNAISDTRRLSRNTLDEIPEVRLDFHAWGEDFDYLYFRNGAVKVTKDDYELIPYTQFPYAVNENAIIDEDFEKLDTPLFTIAVNPDLEAKRMSHQMRMKELNQDNADSERIAFRGWEKLWKWQLSFPCELADMPCFVRFLYNTGRIYWKKEEVGMRLRPEEVQFQDAHFVNKVGALGYMLSRYRTDTRQQLVTATDYRVVDEGKNSGRSGKSTISNFLLSVRKGVEIQGKSFKTSSENMAKNFAEYKPNEHYFGFIDDLKLDVKAETFFNLASGTMVKNLYSDEYTLDKSEALKLFITMNRGFDWTDPSTFGRLYPTLFSDYYHQESANGATPQWTPELEFGRTILTKQDPERVMLQNFMCQCLQFYLSNHEIIIPPVEREGSLRMLYTALKDKDCITYFNKFFDNAHHLERPICIKDMVADYLEFSGEVVNESSCRRATNSFKKNLRVYCDNMSIRINPDIVYKNETDKRSGVVRCNCWAYKWLGNELLPDKPKAKSVESCYYFYRYGNEPKSIEQVLPMENINPDALIYGED